MKKVSSLKNLCQDQFTWLYENNRDVKLIFNGGHISLAVACKGLNVILGLCKCNYSLTVK